MGELTIADIAKAAGVSISTVSRILNGKQDVAQATRERVQQVISDLGYTPHAQAQGLRAGRTRNIALLFPLKYPGNLPYNALELDFVLGAAAAAGESEFFFSLLTTPVTQQNLLSLYRSAQVDGLVLMQIHEHDWRVEMLRESGYPFVMIGRTEDNSGLSFIDLDFEASVIAAFDYLVGNGHRRIGFVALPQQMREQGFGPAARGWAGYQHVLDAHHLTPLYREVNYTAQDIFDAALDMLKEQPDLTAIVTTHEFASLSIIQALKTQAREIPQDCSLIALMTDRIAELSSPPMSHIDFPSYTMGYRAVEMLVHKLEGEGQQEAQQMLLAPRLVVRDSTAPARS
jgi:DNA-binding LacI/PurR family transcriptional regulator